ncbi:TPA: DUF4870 domain-containing protein [Candidatus Berkelbacteria bacterium]|uniref:DUF4870 domain-containing protein n=1 Tax=Berkelbacteria bacterium GW2011_GWE1_39_12 TaxID=1618337 RepID=A0A0G4B3F8_9BACT|nr:MAG: hypothetical protein UT28_C0001G0301 [Berkelbacteria bacterium GW2011_GWE1_39_12]HBO60695.1 DUF4870 domain-containing protein [Candidatus Berkelbacteria bacterium]
MEEHHTPSQNSLDPKVSALLCYLIGFVGGIVFYAISKDKFVRFHAMQSIFLSIAVAVILALLFVISIALPFIFLLTWLFNLGVFAIWIIMMIKSYSGEKYKLPFIGDMAEKYA